MSAGATGVHGTLPAPPERNYGREDRARALASQCAEGVINRLIIMGGPGIGKTTLTRAIATDPMLEAKLGYRRWFVRLEAANDAAGLAGMITSSVGLERTAPFEAALAQLGTAPSLIVLDNLETPWWGDARAVEDTLERLAAVKGLVLVASMRGDRVPGGVSWQQEHLQPLEGTTAERIFLDIAQRIRVDDPDLPRLLEELGGVPLAIRTVAHRVGGSRQLDEIWTEYQALGVTFAQRQDIRRLDHLDSVPVSIELSFRSPLMKEAGRRLFALLGQLPGGLAPGDRRALLAEVAWSSAEELRTAGLAEMRDDDRIDLLPPVRDHARRAHPPEGPDATAWVRHFLILARDIGVQVGRQNGRRAAERLIPEAANLEAAFREAMTGEQLPAAVAAAQGFARFARYTGAGSPAPLLELADCCEAHGDVFGAATAFCCAGDLAFSRSDYPAAGALYGRARGHYERLSDLPGQAYCIRCAGDLLLETSDHKGARELYKQALRLYRRTGDATAKADCLARTGRIALERDLHVRARARFSLARKLYGSRIDGQANCLFRLGEIDRGCEDYDAARREYVEAKELYHRSGLMLGEANCIKALGDLALIARNATAARDGYSEAASMYHQVGAINNEGNAVRGLGDVAHLQGEIALAMALWQRALTLYEQVSERFNVGSIHDRLAQVTEGAAQADHVARACAAWIAIDRGDVVAKLRDDLANGRRTFHS